MRLTTLLFGVVLVTWAAWPAAADDVLDVEPGHAISIGDDSDRFMVEKISPEDQYVLVLLRPRKETCNFRFPVDVGRSVQLRVSYPSGKSFLCKMTLAPIVDKEVVRFSVSCEEKAVSNDTKCPAEGSVEGSH